MYPIFLVYNPKGVLIYRGIESKKGLNPKGVLIQIGFEFNR
jgi:hypothetical protein